MPAETAPLGAPSLEDEEAASLPLVERVHHGNWKIRLAAYKEIKELFYNDYAEYMDSKGSNDAANQ